ncbi:MAG: SDR family NAD(P)-dependent oxidoreductase [Candidatus Sulfotelmatobacter sp.]
MSNPRKSVVITGASSGIGRASVALMNQTGWQVFASVRKTSDQQELQEAYGENVVPVVMDVENEWSIRTAAQHIASQLGGRGLDGLVNCAGIGVVRPIEYASLSELRQIYEINVFGQILVAQSLLHLLRRNRGRIVNITSVGVNIAIPFGGLLNSSKSAFGMLSDSMRLELRPFGIRVIALEPGAISTPAVDKTLGDIEKVIENLPAEARVQYGEMLRAFGRRAYEREKSGSSPDVVAHAVHHALSSNRPRIRYRVGKHARLLATLPKLLPETVLDALRIRMFGLEVPPKGRRETRKPRAASPLRPMAVNPK